MVRSQENKEFQNALLDIVIRLFICKQYFTVIPLNEGSVFFDRETRSTLWNLLNINIPWMNVEVWETSIVSKPVFSEGCTVNAWLSSAPIWSSFGPKIRVAAYLRDFFWGLMICMVWDFFKQIIDFRFTWETALQLIKNLHSSAKLFATLSELVNSTRIFPRYK